MTALGLNFTDQDCWNRIFFYNELDDLQSASFVSKGLQLLVNNCATTVLLNFKLEVTDKTTSLKRLYNLNDLISQWKTVWKKSSSKDEIKRILKNEITSTLPLIVPLFIEQKLGRKKKLHNISIFNIRNKVSTDFNIKDSNLFNFISDLFPLNCKSEWIAHYAITFDPTSTKDLTKLFIENSQSLSVAVCYQNYEKFESLLKEKFIYMMEEDRDLVLSDFSSLTKLSYFNLDIKLLGIILNFFKPFIIQNPEFFTEEEFAVFTTNNDYEAFCKLWNMHRESIESVTKETLGNLAAKKDELELLKKLKALSFDFDTYNRETWNTPLHLVKTVAAAKIILESGANINESNRSYERPLDIAVKKENKELIQYLIEQGANIDVLGGPYFCFKNNGEFVENPEILKLILPTTSFFSLLAIVAYSTTKLKRLVVKEIIYRMRYIILASIIIPAIFLGAIFLL